MCCIVCLIDKPSASKSDYKQKKEVPFWKTSFFNGFAASELLTQAKFFNDGTVAINIAVVQVVQ